MGTLGFHRLKASMCRGVGRSRATPLRTEGGIVIFWVGGSPLGAPACYVRTSAAWIAKKETYRNAHLLFAVFCACARCISIGKVFTIQYTLLLVVCST